MPTWDEIPWQREYKVDEITEKGNEWNKRRAE